MPSTLGDLLPPGQDKSGASASFDAPPPSGAPLGNMLSDGRPLVSSGNIIVPGAMPSPSDDMPKKCETLSDLKALYPELQDHSSGYHIVVERTHPKALNGMSVAGVIGKFNAFDSGRDLLDIGGFAEAFGFGTYIVWVEGPSKNSTDPFTGKPKVVRKAEITHKVPEMPAQPGQMPQVQFIHPSQGHSPVDLERARGEVSIQKMLAERALSSMGGHGGDGTASVATEAMRVQAQTTQATIDRLTHQNEQLTQQVQSLMLKMSERSSEPTTSDELVKTVLSRGNAEVEMMRSNFDAQMRQIQATAEDRIERLRSDYDRRIDQMRQDADRKEAQLRDAHEQAIERMRESHEQAINRERTLGDDRFRNEREHLERQLSSLKSEHERSIDVMRQEYARSLQNHIDNRQRDIEMLERQQAVMIGAKEAEIARLMSENERLKDKVEHLERQVNMPFQDKILEVSKYQELIQAMGGGGGQIREEEDDKKPDFMEKAMEFASTPAGQMLLAAGLQKAGVPIPGLPTGAPPPKQMGPAQPPVRQPAPQGQPRRQRQQPPPVQQVQQQPVQQAQQVQQPTPAPQPEPQPQPQPRPVHQLQQRGPQPMPDADMQKALVYLERALWNGAFSEPPVPPEQAAAQIKMLVEASFPGQDMVSKFHAWVDAENATKILDMVHSGGHSWMPKLPWVTELWGFLAPAAPEAAPTQTS